jgi:regulator of sigma E protease
MSVILLILGLLLFVGLVVAHEFGHFIVARRNGVEVEEFGIGFPPKIWSKKTKKGFLFSINLLPLGGFVRLKGEHDADIEPGTFGASSTWVKTKIMVAGVGMNLLVALIFFTILAWLGMPQLISNQFSIKSDSKVIKNEVLVGTVQNNSPAAKAGLHPRDQLLDIASGSNIKYVSKANGLPNITEYFAGKSVTITYLRNGQTHSANMTLVSTKEVQASLKTNNSKGYLGVAPTEYTLQRSTWSAPIVALGITKQFTVLTFKGLWTAITSLLHGNTAAASSQVSGPVGIFVLLKDGSLLGYQLTLMIVAIVSLSLAIMNVLPIPALDGGHLFVTYISRILKKPVAQNVEDWVYGVSFVFLLGLVALITVVDVKRFF